MTAYPPLNHRRRSRWQMGPVVGAVMVGVVFLGVMAYLMWGGSGKQNQPSTANSLGSASTAPVALDSNVSPPQASHSTPAISPSSSASSSGSSATPPTSAPTTDRQPTTSTRTLTGITSSRPTSTGAGGGGSNERMITTAYVTAYTWQDNTPPGSADISHPILHQKAGGTGTFEDPLTIAVGHDLSSGSDVLDYPAGTKMYIPNVRKYFIVEDTCGDGPAPENAGCHDLSTADSGATTWVDMWIGGQGMTKAETDACAGDLTGIHTIVINPKSSYVVQPGAGVFANGQCNGNFGDSLG